MSSGPSPNSGNPKKSGGMSTTARLGGRLTPSVGLAVLALAGTYLFYSTRAPHMPSAPNPLRTPGVRNIEQAYSNGGATSTHTPAYGGTQMGKRDHDGLKEGGAKGSSAKEGMQTEGIGEEQRPVQPGVVGEKLHEMEHGSKTGK